MEVVPVLVDFVVFTAVVLLWARWWKLDLGLRTPALESAWPWILLFVAWVGIERAVVAVHPIEADPEWREWMARLSLVQSVALIVVLAPVFEELLFRGAMFSALLRRWGIWAATVVPSLLWGLIHTQYEWWVALSIAGSGMILAIIRWKSGSLYPPLALHAAANLVATLHFHGLSGSAGTGAGG